MPDGMCESKMRDPAPPRAGAVSTDYTVLTVYYRGDTGTPLLQSGMTTVLER